MMFSDYLQLKKKTFLKVQAIRNASGFGWALVGMRLVLW